jgi:hypothetical protein
MARVLDATAFIGWLHAYLPALAHGRPTTIFTPAVVSDESDALIARLHGLNLSRSYCWRRIAQSLSGDDARVGVMHDASKRHLAASLDRVTGGECMLEHWPACYAILAMAEPQAPADLP